jgi:hypothetical protein
MTGTDEPQVLASIEEMLTANRAANFRYIRFCVGKYGRTNMFWLREGLFSSQRTIATLTAYSDGLATARFYTSSPTRRKCLSTGIR